MGKGTKIITEWIGAVMNEYFEFIKESAPHRCKIINMEICKETGKTKFLVKINNVKNQIFISYTPEELVSNDAMLREFSQTDVRAITFYAFNQLCEKKEMSSYSIIGQEFENNKTIFVIRKKTVDCKSEFRKRAHELYCSPDILKQFKFEDLMNIIQTAVQEQTIEDLE